MIITIVLITVSSGLLFPGWVGELDDDDESERPMYTEKMMICVRISFIKRLRNNAHPII